jgi:uncharacterized protein (DUF2164 family)
MPFELSKSARADAIASIRQYFERNMPEAIGDLPAGLLLDFFLEEIGPVIYNQAVTQAADRLQMRIADLPGELYADPFQYWVKQEAKNKRRV